VCVYAGVCVCVCVPVCVTKSLMPSSQEGVELQRVAKPIVIKFRSTVLVLGPAEVKLIEGQLFVAQLQTLSIDTLLHN